MHAAAERLGLSPEAFRMVGGWPDTETNLGLILMEHGIKCREFDQQYDGYSHYWLCLGDEPNEPYDTPWFRHERSFTSQALYCPDHAEKRREAVQKTMAETWERIARWKAGKME